MTIVRVNRQGIIGELILCGTKTLNALTHKDIKAFKAGLDQHVADSSVRAIVVRSESGKAFCAGGDMKQIREHILAERFDEIKDYFSDEYSLNLAISRCTKPYISLMHGITMGGGLGISVHGTARIVTETSLLAMPETRIGFFPDVGASYFLPRLPHRAGYWLALTADSVTGPQAVRLGLATHYMDSSRLDEIIPALNAALDKQNLSSTAAWFETVEQCLEAMGETVSDEKFERDVEKRSAWFADDHIPAIRHRLTVDSLNNDKDATRLLMLLDEGSPYSEKITLQLLREAAGQDLQNCLLLELALSDKAVRYPDCAEGVRAVLVDKDRKPVWQN